jgi:hypothetical protein
MRSPLRARGRPAWSPACLCVTHIIRHATCHMCQQRDGGLCLSRHTLQTRGQRSSLWERCHCPVVLSVPLFDFVNAHCCATQLKPSFVLFAFLGQSSCTTLGAPTRNQRRQA